MCNFEIVYFSFLDGDVYRHHSYNVYHNNIFHTLFVLREYVQMLVFPATETHLPSYMY